MDGRLAQVARSANLPSLSGEKQFFDPAHLQSAMSVDKQPNPPVDVIPEDSGPPLTDRKEPAKNPEGLDVDDAQIEEPKDDAFKKTPQKEQPPRKKKKAGSSGFD